MLTEPFSAWVFLRSRDARRGPKRRRGEPLPVGGVGREGATRRPNQTRRPKRRGSRPTDICTLQTLPVWAPVVPNRFEGGTGVGARRVQSYRTWSPRPSHSTIPDLGWWLDYPKKLYGCAAHDSQVRQVGHADLVKASQHLKPTKTQQLWTRPIAALAGTTPCITTGASCDLPAARPKRRGAHFAS